MDNESTSTKKNIGDQKESDTTKTGSPSWPGGFGIYKTSSAAIKLNLATVLTLVGLSIAISIVLSPIQKQAYLYNAIAQIFSLLISIALYITYLAGVNDKKIEISEAIQKTFSLPLILNMIGLWIIATVSVVVGFILFIIPGLIILPRLVLAPYFLIDQKLGFIEAYKASWNSTKGHAMKAWGIIGVSFLMILPVLTIIGILATIYLLFMYAAAFAVLYKYVKETGPISK